MYTSNRMPAGSGLGSVSNAPLELMLSNTPLSVKGAPPASIPSTLTGQFT